MNIISKKRFIHILYQLGRPFSYYSIKHSDRYIYILWIPCILSLLTLCLMFFSDIEIFLGSNGIISKVNEIVSGLPGFFIAALAAVATFNKPEIDKELNPKLYVDLKISGVYQPTSISRRRLLCMLFSNLTAISLLITITTSILLKVTASYPIALAGVFFYFFIIWQMITSTLIGLFYLGEKIHTPS